MGQHLQSGHQAAEKEKVRLAQLAADRAAEAAFYKAQRASYLETLGIKPEDAPEFKPTAPVADPAKQVTPGTPTLVDPNVIIARAGDGMTAILDIQSKYFDLYGKPMSLLPSQLIQQADALKLQPMEYAARTFKFAEMEEQRRQAAAKAHDDEIRTAEAAARDAAHKAEVEKLQNDHNAEMKKLAEQSGHGANPDLRTPPGSAKFADLQRATKAGERPRPDQDDAGRAQEVDLEQYSQGD